MGTQLRRVKSELKTLNTVWIGDRLGYLEQLCLESALACGHQVRLFSYQPKNLRGVPQGVEVHHAAEVMPYERMLTYRGSNSFALGSNFWRYEMLARGLGYWVDLDILLLKPLSGAGEYVFGAEHEFGLNTAVLYAPADSNFVRDLRTLPQPDRCPAWFGPRQRLQFYLKRLTHGPIGLEDFPWGTFGPRMLTYVAKRHDVFRYAEPPDVFYPISWRDARSLYGPADQVNARLSEQTRTVHLFNSQLRELAQSPPPPGSFIAEQCERLGVFKKRRGLRKSRVDAGDASHDSRRKRA